MPTHSVKTARSILSAETANTHTHKNDSTCIVFHMMHEEIFPTHRRTVEIPNIHRHEIFRTRDSIPHWSSLPLSLFLSSSSNVAINMSTIS